MALTSQRSALPTNGTTIVWDRRTGAPVCNAIVWQDRRTANICDRLKAEGLEALFTGRTGLVLDAYFSGTKLRWVLIMSPVHAGTRRPAICVSARWTAG
jgi:glycerol kinase